MKFICIDAVAVAVAVAVDFYQQKKIQNEYVS